MPIVKVSCEETTNRTWNDGDVAADDVETLSGLLEAVAMLMTGVQPGLQKVCHALNRGWKKNGFFLF